MTSTTVGGLAAHLAPGPADALPLVLAHGLTDDGRCWPEALPRWVEHPVVALDLPSHGHSRRLTTDEHDDPMRAVAAAVGRALHEVAEEHGRAAAGVGHSMGAGALALAALDGAPVDRLVLEDPRIAHPTTAARARMGRMRARELRVWREHPERARAELDAALPGWPAAEVEAAAAARPLGDPDYLALGRSGLVGDDALSIDLLARLATRVPTMLVTGDRPGVVWVPALVERLRATGAPVEIVVVHGGDHCVRRTAPEGYHRSVDAFLAR